jgi:hypothetical protein
MTLVLNEDTLIFGEVRSPGTLRNISHNPNIEVNHFDILARKAERIQHIVKIDIFSAKLIKSPAYDIGSEEDELIARWKSHYAAL